MTAGQGPQEAYSSNFNQWMVVGPSMVTTTGLECDKIGVSYKYALVSGWGCHGGARGVQGFMPSHFNVGGPAYT